MALQRVTLRLTGLRAVKQSEGSGGSEPYLWVTYLAVGAQPLPFQTGPVGTITPAYDAFRTEFADGVRAGDVLTVPPFLAEASFEMDLDPDPAQRKFKYLGCIAVLMEEDATPHSSIVLGRIAYSKEIDRQLNELVNKRISTGDDSPITDAELDAIRLAVQDKVYDAIGSNQSIWNLFTNQDDNVGFAYRLFGGPEISQQAFDFPDVGTEDSPDHYVLSGALEVGPLPTGTVDLCGRERAQRDAKQDEIKFLQDRRTLLQNELVHAAPQNKASIVAEIGVVNDAITHAEAELPPLQAALDSCIDRRGGHPGGFDVDPTIGVGPR